MHSGSRVVAFWLWAIAGFKDGTRPTILDSRISIRHCVQEFLHFVGRIALFNPALLIQYLPGSNTEPGLL